MTSQYDQVFGAVIIGLSFVVGSYLLWRHLGKPVNNERDLLRRIYVLETQVDEMSKCISELDRLRLEVEFLRKENYDLLLTLSRYMRGERMPDIDRQHEVDDLMEQLESRQRNLAAIEKRMAIYPAGAAPVDIVTQRDREVMAIDSLKRRLDFLQE